MTRTFLDRPVAAIKFIGLWFPPGKYKVLYLIYRWCLLINHAVFITFNFIQMAMVWGDWYELSEIFYVFSTAFTIFLKEITLLANQEKLSGLLDFMDSDIFLPHSSIHVKIILGYASKLWPVYRVLLVCGLSVIGQWAIFSLFGQGPREFPVNTIWMPADTTKDLDYYIGYTFQISSVATATVSYISIDVITAYMIMFACAQLEIVADRIIKVEPLTRTMKVEEMEKLIHENNKTLHECIQQQQAVKRFVGLVENIFNMTIFLQMAGSVIIICCIGLQMVVIQESKSIDQLGSALSYLTTVLAQLFLYCWCGSELTDRSDAVRDALYASPWLSQDRRFRSALVLAMECMKQPMVFRTGYYIPLSRPTFVSIVRCSYSYFAVLNQAKNNNNK